MRDILPDLTTLRILKAIGDTGTFGRAATGAGMSQQAASARIRAAETLLGLPLVHRTKNGSSLTTAGQLLVEWSIGLFDAADQLALSVRALRADASAVLTIAASQTIAEAFIPGWMAEFRRRLGEEHAFRLTSGNSVAVIEEVRNGAAVIGLIETPEIPSDLASATIRDDELIVVVAPDHPWTRLRVPLDPAELASVSLVARETGSGTRRTLELALTRHHPGLVPAEPVAVLSTTGAIRAAVMSGMGPAVLSAASVRDDLERGAMMRIPLDNLALSRPLTALWSPGVTLPVSAEILFSILRG